MVCLLACGLERDWERWQQASQGGTDGPGSDTSSGEAASTAAETSGSEEGGSTSTGETSTGEVDAETTSETSTGETSTGGSTTTGPASVCGDGVVSGDEECDDPGDVHCFKCYRDRLVFVTSQLFQGDWAASGIDYWCNHLAAKAGLITNNEFRFKPWISTSEGSPADRLFHSPGRYILRNDLVFAESWDDLVAGNILNSLNVDENSETRNVSVWTDTRPDGTAIAAMDGDHCGDWTDDSWDGWANAGWSSDLDGNWTLDTDDGANPTPCDFVAALYCFESP